MLIFNKSYKICILTSPIIIDNICGMFSPVEASRKIEDKSSSGITVESVSRYKYNFILQNPTRNAQPYLLNALVKKSMQEDMRIKDLSLSGPIEISLGTDCLLLVDENQVEAFEVVFGIFSTSVLPFYATVANAEDNSERVETLVNFFSGRSFSGAKPKTVNHFIVSRGLAERLKLKNDKNIKILGVYQKPSDVDLLDQ